VLDEARTAFLIDVVKKFGQRHIGHIICILKENLRSGFLQGFRSQTEIEERKKLEYSRHHYIYCTVSSFGSIMRSIIEIRLGSCEDTNTNLNKKFRRQFRYANAFWS